MRRLLLSLLLPTLWLPGVASTVTPCPNGGTLADYITLGSVGCVVGAMTLGNFTWTSSDGVPPSAVPVLILNDATGAEAVPFLLPEAPELLFQYGVGADNLTNSFDTPRPPLR